MEPKKVLITGVAGIVGSSAYLHLSRFPEKYDLYGLGRRRTLSERVRDDRQVDLPDEKFIVCDISDMEGVQKAVEGMDVVVHMAADPAGRNWDSLVSANLVGAYNIFEASIEAGVKRVIAASTIQVVTGYRGGQEPYKSIAEGKIDRLPEGFDKVGSDSPAEPRNLYASTKVFNESLCRTYAYSRGMSCFGIRVGWVVAEDRPPHPNAMDIWCSQKDISRLIQCCIDAPEEERFGIFFGLSESKRRWCDLENARERVGYVPEDWGEDFL